MNKTSFVMGIAALFIAGCGSGEQPAATSAGQSGTTQTAPAPEETKSVPAETMPAPTESMPAQASPPTVAETPKHDAPAAATTAGDPVHGKVVYAGTCAACHAVGVAGAPKLGDNTAWAPRLAQGMDVLVDHATHGFQGKAGVMPPKGGGMQLSDQDVADAVAYMAEQAK